MSRLMKSVAAVLLADHTAANGDDQRGILGFYMLVLSDDRQSFFLRVLTDGTGIDNYQVCIIGCMGKLVSHGLGNARKALAVSLVLLTAEGLHEGFRGMSVLRAQLIGVGSHLGNIFIFRKSVHFAHFVPHFGQD